ncbi:MAG: aminodeoxychorismate synthase component I [Fimbriimonadales bacterium]|nr:MAG: aminodeoxychorismate synthase, component I [Fimbriimonadales bacterium]
MAAYVLLRYGAPDGQPCWLEGRNPVGVVAAHTHAEVLPALSQVDRATAQGLTAVGFVSYEAAHGLDPAFPRADAPLPLVWFALFRQLTPVNPPNAENSPATWENSPALRWQGSVSPCAYEDAVDAIRAAIAAGEVYQVNYSFRLRAPFEGDLLPLFWQLYARQPVPYAAYLDIGAHAIASLSPELFFARAGERLWTRPMKGTAPRGRTLADDLRRADQLTRCPKNRAENLMIVDMARNDLGRVARVGTVRVPRLFEAERYATLWQMTSTVVACTDAPLREVFRALFPAASITGAPKIQATRVIHQLEPDPRGVYTGAIGVVMPDGHAQFSVAIRTLHHDRQAERLEYGVGSGVVWDSERVAEYEECLTKAQVLFEARPAFELLETLLWRRERGYFLLEAHLRRLCDSACYFDFAVDADALRRALLQVAESFTEPRYRVRLLVNRRGQFRMEYAPFTPERRVWRVALARAPVNPREAFLYHKTTHRQVYERARAEHPDCDDVILWNTRGEITESTLANVVVRLEGRYWTPPVSCGLLAGVYRERLLQRGLVQERVLTLDDLRRAEAIYLVNSVRGWVRVELQGTAG